MKILYSPLDPVTVANSFKVSPNCCCLPSLCVFKPKFHIQMSDCQVIFLLRYELA